VAPVITSDVRDKGEHAMRRWVLIAVVGLAVLPAPERAGAQSAFPDPTRWNGEGVVRILEQNAGALLSGIYRLGGFDAGESPVDTVNDMALRNASAVLRMEATVTLLDASASGAGVGTFPRAGLEGFFYWNGQGTGGASDRTGHVLASIHLALNTETRDPEARYLVARCDDAACAATTTVASAAIAQVDFFQPHRLKVSYDGAAFAFQVDGAPAVEVAAPDVNRLGPTVPLKALRTRTVVPAAPSAFSSILALFDDVAVNGAPYDGFQARTLPRVQVLPASGTFSPHQTFDVVIMVETAAEPVIDVQLTVNGADLSHLLPLAIPGTLPSGGRTYRFANVPASALGGAAPIVVGATATTVGGKKARGVALWNLVDVDE
jgi:hypothetical protein